MRTWMYSLPLLAVACGASPPATQTAGAPHAAAPGLAQPDAGEAPGLPPGTPRYDAKTFYDTVAIAGASFSHDGSRILFSRDATGVFNVYSQPVTGGSPTQLTKSTKESLFAVSYFPADDRFLFASDTAGNELTHLWVGELDGSVRDLTPGDKLKASFAGWRKDKKAFFVITNERDPRFFDLYRYATDGYARTLVFQNDGGFTIDAVSPDGRYLALSKVNNNADNNLFVVDLDAKKPNPKLITKHKGSVEYQALTFTADSKKLVYSTNAHGEFAQAWEYNLRSGKHRPELQASWDVTSFYYSEHGKYRVVVTNEDARSVLAIVDTRSGRTIVPKGVPSGDITRATFDRAEKQMAFYLSSDRTPPDLFVLDLANGDATRLTNNLNPKIDPANLVDGSIVRYPSFDGLEIPAILYRPVDAGPDARAPALVWVHGGPGGQSRLGYSPLIQYLVNHGYAVLAVNNRGSSGYGKTFYHLDDKKHGDVDLKDCVFGRTYLATLDWVDGERIGIMGGSYGGYLTVAALAFEPDVFDVGVDIFGPTNWVRTLESIPPWWASFRDALYSELGDPAADKERLVARSPLFHAKHIKKPLLVIQGANDPRALKVESDDIVAAVKKNGVPVEYLVFEDEGHGFRKKPNQIAAAEKIRLFLDRYLRGR